LRAYEVRLEEVRAALNADFSAAMATRERDDQSRFKRQRTAWEAQVQTLIASESGQTYQTLQRPLRVFWLCIFL